MKAVITVGAVSAATENNNNDSNSRPSLLGIVLGTIVY